VATCRYNLVYLAAATTTTTTRARGSAHLLQDGSDVPQGKRAELAVLEEVVQVLLQHLEHQAGVTFVLEAFVGTHKVVLVGVLCTQPVEDADLEENTRPSEAQRGGMRAPCSSTHTQPAANKPHRK